MANKIGSGQFIDFDFCWFSGVVLTIFLLIFQFWFWAFMINRCSVCWFDNINILLRFSALLKVISDRINNLQLNMSKTIWWHYQASLVHFQHCLLQIHFQIKIFHRIKGHENASLCHWDSKSSKKNPTSTVTDNERKGSNAIEKSDLCMGLDNNLAQHWRVAL